MRAALSLATAILLLSGCMLPPPLPQKVAAPPPASPPQPAIPKPVWPNPCAEDWYATAELPACVKDWIADLSAQQAKLAKKQRHK